MKKKHFLTLAAFMAAVLFTSMAEAATTPTSGDLAYSWYDIVINQLIGGPIGYTIGAGGVGWGIGKGIVGTDLKSPVITTALSAAFLGVNAIVSTMGAIY